MISRACGNSALVEHAERLKAPAEHSIRAAQPDIGAARQVLRQTASNCAQVGRHHLGLQAEVVVNARGFELKQPVLRRCGCQSGGQIARRLVRAFVSERAYGLHVHHQRWTGSADEDALRVADSNDAGFAAAFTSTVPNACAAAAVLWPIHRPPSERA